MENAVTISYKLAEINKAAERFLATIGDNNIIAFSGEMGAGKTTFIHHFCELLGVQDAVSSPTFSLINEYRYESDGKEHIIYHMDWYRLKSTEEAINAGMEDCILQGHSGAALCLVEWPEKARQLITRPYVWVAIHAADEHTRTMTIEFFS